MFILALLILVVGLLPCLLRAYQVTPAGMVTGGLAAVEGSITSTATSVGALSEAAAGLTDIIDKLVDEIGGLAGEFINFIPRLARTTDEVKIFKQALYDTALVTNFTSMGLEKLWRTTMETSRATNLSAREVLSLTEQLEANSRVLINIPETLQKVSSNLKETFGYVNVRAVEYMLRIMEEFPGVFEEIQKGLSPDVFNRYFQTIYLTMGPSAARFIKNYYETHRTGLHETAQGMFYQLRIVQRWTSTMERSVLEIGREFSKAHPLITDTLEAIGRTLYYIGLYQLIRHPGRFTERIVGWWRGGGLTSAFGGTALGIGGTPLIGGAGSLGGLLTGGALLIGAPIAGYYAGRQISRVVGATPVQTTAITGVSTSVLGTLGALGAGALGMAIPPLLPLAILAAGLTGTAIQMRWQRSRELTEKQLKDLERFEEVYGRYILAGWKPEHKEMREYVREYEHYMEAMYGRRRMLGIREAMREITGSYEEIDLDKAIRLFTRFNKQAQMQAYLSQETANNYANILNTAISLGEPLDKIREYGERYVKSQEETLDYYEEMDKVMQRVLKGKDLELWNAMRIAQIEGQRLKTLQAHIAVYEARMKYHQIDYDYAKSELDLYKAMGGFAADRVDLVTKQIDAVKKEIAETERLIRTEAKGNEYLRKQYETRKLNLEAQLWMLERGKEIENQTEKIVTLASRRIDIDRNLIAAAQSLQVPYTAIAGLVKDISERTKDILEANIERVKYYTKLREEYAKGSAEYKALTNLILTATQQMTQAAAQYFESIAYARRTWLEGMVAGWLVGGRPGGPSGIQYLPSEIEVYGPSWQPGALLTGRSEHWRGARSEEINPLLLPLMRAGLLGGLERSTERWSTEMSRLYGTPWQQRSFFERELGKIFANIRLTIELDGKQIDGHIKEVVVNGLGR